VCGLSFSRKDNLRRHQFTSENCTAFELGSNNLNDVNHKILKSVDKPVCDNDCTEDETDDGDDSSRDAPSIKFKPKCSLFKRRTHRLKHRHKNGKFKINGKPIQQISNMKVKSKPHIPDMEIKSIHPINNLIQAHSLRGIGPRAHKVFQYYTSKGINVA